MSDSQPRVTLGFPWKVDRGLADVAYYCELRREDHKYDTPGGYDVGAVVTKAPYGGLKWEAWIGGTGRREHDTLNQAIADAEQRLVQEVVRRRNKAQAEVEKWEQYRRSLEGEPSS